MMASKQTDLFGKELDLAPEEVNEVCCTQCYTAKDEPCTCKCGGTHHGKAHQNEEDDTDAIQEAERRAGADGTDEYRREIMGENELTEPCQDEDNPEIQEEEDNKPVLEYYRSLITHKDCDCKGWKRSSLPMPDLSKLPIEHYDHDGGWAVKGFKELQWLYVTCPRCGYQWALHKLGVSRKAGSRDPTVTKKFLKAMEKADPL